jgi:protein-S-isoprenylcysteine O-methyltransferase Ste14
VPEDDSMKHTGVRDAFIQRGGLWVLVQCTLLLVIVGLAVACGGESRNSSVFVFGLILLAIAALCGIAGAVALGRNLTPFPKPSRAAWLVKRGIYRLIRHPLYSSVLCGAFGLSLVRQSWPALIASLALAVFFDAKARREELWLRQRFPEYADYALRVRRFIPWIY